MVLEQKYLEHLEAGRVLDALHVLRNELTPLQYDTPRVHRLSALMMCADARELQARAHWAGAGAQSRAAVLARVQAVLPPALMMAPNRLRALLAQAALQQSTRCRFHAQARPPQGPDNIPFTLLADHHCSADHFPIHSLQVTVPCSCYSSVYERLTLLYKRKPFCLFAHERVYKTAPILFLRVPQWLLRRFSRFQHIKAKG